MKKSRIEKTRKSASDLDDKQRISKSNTAAATVTTGCGHGANTVGDIEKKRVLMDTTDISTEHMTSRSPRGDPDRLTTTLAPGVYWDAQNTLLEIKSDGDTNWVEVQAKGRPGESDDDVTPLGEERDWRRAVHQHRPADSGKPPYQVRVIVSILERSAHHTVTERTMCSVFCAYLGN